MHLTAAAEQQAAERPLQVEMRELNFVIRRPFFAGLPLAVEHIGMCERLLEPFVPAFTAQVEPELVPYGTVLH